MNKPGSRFSRWCSGLFSPQVEDSVRLRLLAMGIFWVSALGLGWVGGNWWFVAGGCVLGALGHYASWRWRHNKSKIRPLAIGLVVAGLSFWMRFQALAVLNGDWVPVGHFLILVLGISSFDLRTRGGLYTSLALSGTVLFFASQQAFAAGFIVFFIGFLVLLLGFMALSFLEDAIREAKVYWRKGTMSLSLFWLGASCSLFLLSGLAFWLIPRGDTSLIGQPQVSILPYSASTLDPAETGPDIGPQDLTGPNSIADIPLPKASVAKDLIGLLGDVFPPGDLSPGGLNGKAADTGAETVTSAPSPDSPNVTLSGLGTTGQESITRFGGSGPPQGVAFYVRSKVASYWRGRTLSFFDGQRWLPETGSGPWVPLENQGGSFFNRESRNLDNSVRYHQDFFIRQDHPNSVSMGYRGLKLAAGGGGLIGSSVHQGDSYRVVSAQPRDNPQRLRNDHTVVTDLRFLLLPAEMSGRLKGMTMRITQGSGTDFQRLERIVAYLVRETGYEPDPRENFGRSGKSRRIEVDKFLLNQQAGDDLEYATALTLLARASGIPARLASGYLPGVRDPLSGAYMVRNADARTWSEIYFATHGWVPFDSTPGAAAPADAATGVSRLFQRGFGQAASGSIQNLRFEMPGGWLEKLGSPWLAVAGACVGLAGLVLRWWCTQRKDSPQNPSHQPLRYSRPTSRSRLEILKLYRQAEKLLRHRLGVGRLPWQTAFAYTNMANVGSPELQRHLSWCVQAVWLAAYSPQEPGQAMVLEGRQRLSGIRKALKQHP